MNENDNLILKEMYNSLTRITKINKVILFNNISLTPQPKSLLINKRLN